MVTVEGKAAYPTEVIELGIFTSVSFVEENAPLPIVFNRLPNVTEVNLEQPLKADSPILCKLSPNVTEVNPEQPLKADPPILCKLSLNMTEVNPEQLLKA